jgi:hypothetical protein
MFVVEMRTQHCRLYIIPSPLSLSNTIGNLDATQLITGRQDAYKKTQSL